MRNKALPPRWQFVFCGFLHTKVQHLWTVEYIELFLTIFFHCNLIGLITLFYIQNVLRPLLPCYPPAFSGIPRYPWVQRTNKVPYNLRERYSLNLTLTFNKNADGNC